jgi:phosphoribosylformylglycinamidine synthase I
MTDSHFSSAVIVFPGSNCDRDAFTALKAQGMNPRYVWHTDASLPKVDLVVLPGGFSYGDYLRCGAMAARSPIVREVSRHANAGGLVLGICNGFQILCEAGLLPGTLLRNRHMHFNCHDVMLRVESTDSPFTRNYRAGQVVNFPIAHMEGNYFADAETIAALEGEQRVIFRYVTAEGKATPEANPNGAIANIAGITNPARNVLGLMPHPERHCDLLTGGVDGVALFESLRAA